MARTGRPPKPTALKLLEGNRGRRTLNPHEPQPGRDQVTCPSWLDAFARREWRRLAPELSALGLLTNFDVGTLAGYCQAIADARRFTVYLRKNGDTCVDEHLVARARPERKMLENAWTRIHAFGSEFGFSPASRSRVVTNAGEMKDRFDELFG